MCQQNSPFTAVFVKSRLRLPLTATFHLSSSDFSVVDLVAVANEVRIVNTLSFSLLFYSIDCSLINCLICPNPSSSNVVGEEDCLLDPMPASTSLSFQMSYLLFYFCLLMLPLTITLHLSSSDLVMIDHVAVAVNVPVVVTLVLFVVVFFHQRLACSRIASHVCPSPSSRNVVGWWIAY